MDEIHPNETNFLAKIMPNKEMQQILVALDFGDASQQVFPQALTFAQKTQASLTLLNVLAPHSNNDDSFAISSPYSDGQWSNYAEQCQTMATARLGLLNALAEQAKAAGVTVKCLQDVGSPGAVICRLAIALEVDLIMVGSHQRTGLSEMFLGSVSNYVVHHAPCSVLIVHH